MQGSSWILRLKGSNEKPCLRHVFGHHGAYPGIKYVNMCHKGSYLQYTVLHAISSSEEHLALRDISKSISLRAG